MEIIADEKTGWVKSIRCIRMELGEPDASGRRRPVEIPGSEFNMDCDTVIMSLGTSPNPLISSTTVGLDVNKRKCIIASEENGQTTKEGVFAGGDCVTGPATVIRAIAAGKVAAANIDEYLGYHHVIDVGVEVPTARLNNKPPHGRINTTEREADERKRDFKCIECGLTDEEAYAEASRCLRCDHFGYGIFKGGRVAKW